MNEFEQRMAVLRARFAERCASDAAALRQAWNDGNHEELQRLLHGLAGNAGVFGYLGLSASARELEEALDTGPADAMVATKLGALCREMAAIARDHRT